MGLGRLALGQILPVFAECRQARPVALISGDSAKYRAIAARYGITADACYDYASIGRIRDNAAIEAVYVVTPNTLHRDNVIAAAKAEASMCCVKNPWRLLLQRCRTWSRPAMMLVVC
ncbi:Gfo/Idh/MocA family oxidoreductase [Komagataeibacter oboediens]|uniref:Gfo/Idh/MocA family oxidoreductase n=1 Tax=Komagataeibacter oboediens TaxID=65958 RepID=UPI001C2C4C68|nr:Gfo/Idh/MocA family oxidoreductase [Komagataeibacter oboediens]MBV0886950.1 Gfo/Idh/MocA family oxidoreductase [Komagataeibacter oboediens]MCK9820499.1 Gfo/Idh/MocA family oxidoreductase [Komagataeibacter oboediens]